MWEEAITALFVCVLAYAFWQHGRSKSQAELRWSVVTLPEQELWMGIRSYLRHPTLPVLTFENERVGLGDPTTMADIARRFEPRRTDVNIVTYPKAGTSWIQEVAWLVNHEADIEKANAIRAGVRTVYIELRFPSADKLAELAAAPAPRHVKWHHSASLLPAQVVGEGRIIYLYRNPKDTVVSWYHFQRMNALYGFTGSFDEFFELFLKGHVAYGCYWHNVLSWWKLRHQPNILILTYEEMHADLPAVVRKVSDFLGRRLSEEAVATIAQHCQFEQMKANPTTNAAAMPKIAGESDFMRKGQVGDWRNYLSDEQSRRMDMWTEEHAGSENLPLVYTL